MPEKFRRIGIWPTIRVTALRFTGNFDAVEKFVGGDAEFRDGKLVVATRQGPLWALNGEWIVRDANGHFATYPDHLFTDAFERTSERKGK